jgi:hypothetical protein
LKSCCATQYPRFILQRERNTCIKKGGIFIKRRGI